ncbi:MAG: hypothetical protein B6U69_03025 [Thermofilum sp. ex4484_15]|nr:MAG: hypothetical protein B6U69_03025 [Thermofilum sp. ex4484_15]
MEYKILKGKEGIKRAYELLAERYDSSKYLFWTRKIEKGEERVISRWIAKLNGPCLDVGCGTGRYSLKLARLGIPVIALDLSLGMVKELLRKASSTGLLDLIQPVLGDGEMLPFRGESFKSLICTLAFDHFENPEAAVREFSRVLKGGSLCILSTFNSFTLRELQERCGLGDNVCFRVSEDLTVIVYEVGHSVFEIWRMFEKYGFRLVAVKGCCYWHVLPLPLSLIYPLMLDNLLSRFKNSINYAEIHVCVMRRMRV